MLLNKEDIYKEIDLIQACITRMANNSFSMKGWHVGIISALLIFFFDKDSININTLLIIIAAITLVFWYLDSYFLMLERKYRWMYAWVIKNRVSNNTPKTDYLFNLNPDEMNMWEVNKQSKGYKAAEKTRKAIGEEKNGIIISICRLKEVWIVMSSNTMEIQYLIVLAVSILSFILVACK